MTIVQKSKYGTHSVEVRTLSDSELAQLHRELDILCDGTERWTFTEAGAAARGFRIGPDHNPALRCECGGKLIASDTLTGMLESWVCDRCGI